MRALLLGAVLALAALAPLAHAAVQQAAPAIEVEVEPTVARYDGALDAHVHVSKIGTGSPAPGTSILLRLPVGAQSLAPPEPSAGWQRVTDFVERDGRLQVEYRPAVAAPRVELELHVDLLAFGPSACAPGNSWEIEASVVGASNLVPVDIVCDRIAPVVQAPADMRVEATGPTGAVVAFVPLVTDDTQPAPAATCSPASGTTFALGAHTVTCGATDEAGNVAASVSFEVVVVDATPPTIEQPTDIVAEATGPDGAAVAFAAPATDDVVDGAGVATCAPASGSVFPIADATTVTCAATDAAGNAAAVTFDVSVADTTPPALAPMLDIAAEATSPAGADVAFAPPASSDLVDGAIGATCDRASGGFPFGATTVTCTATDAAGNSAEGSFVVTVADTTPPALSEVADIILEAEGEDGAFASFDAPTTTDAVDGPGVAECDDEPRVYPLGVTAVVCIAEDAAGNADATGFYIAVVDETAPAIAAVEDLVVEAEGPEGAVVDYDVPVAADLVDGEVEVACSPAPGDVFAIGTTEVACSAEDAEGNLAETAFLVLVADTTAPALDELPDITLLATSGDGALAEFEPPAWTDAVDGEGVAACDGESGLFPIGETLVACGVEDAAGNVAEITFLVTVEPRPVALTIGAPAGSSRATVGQPHAASIRIENLGDEVAAFELALHVDGLEVATQNVTLAGTTNDTFIAHWTPTATGKHQVRFALDGAEGAPLVVAVTAPQRDDDRGSSSGSSGRARSFLVVDDASASASAQAEDAPADDAEESAADADDAGAEASAEEPADQQSDAPAAEPTDEPSGDAPAITLAAAPEGIARSPARIAFDAPAEATVYWRILGSGPWTAGREADVAGDGPVTIEYYAYDADGVSERQTIELELDGLAPVIHSARAEGGIALARIRAAADDSHMESVRATLTGTRGEGEHVIELAYAGGAWQGDASGLAGGEYRVVVTAFDEFGQSASYELPEEVLVTGVEPIEESSIEGAQAGVPGFGLAAALVAIGLVALALRRRA